MQSKNILEFRRRELSNLVWVLKRPHMNTVTYPAAMIQQTICNDFVLTNCEMEIVAKILSEITYGKSGLTIKLLGYIVTKLLKRIYSQVLILDEPKLLTLRRTIKDKQVVFLPTHRSYLDFIILSYICFSYDIPTPVTAAAIDFKNMKGISVLLRKSGAFFIRRNVNNLTLYWTIFRQYVNFLISNKVDPIEFFIEGTRSRSGKFLVPKTGLLSMILEPYFSSKVTDLVIVPISLTYDKILEDKLFAYELIGVPKPKESTKALLNSLSFLNHNYGRILVNIDPEISVKDYFEGKIDRKKYTKGPLTNQQDNFDGEDKEKIRYLCNEIIDCQKRNYPVTVFNLMAIIFNYFVIQNNLKLTLDMLMGHVNYLKWFFPADLIIFQEKYNVTSEIKTALKIHNDLLEMDENQEIKLKRTSFDSADKDFLCHKFASKSVNEIVPRIMMQLYINNVLHYVIELCILIRLIKVHKILKKDLMKFYFESLRNFLKYEFVLFHDTDTAFETNFKKLLESNLTTIDNDCVTIEDSEIEKCAILDVLITPFLKSFTYVFQVLFQAPSSELIGEKSLLSMTQKVIENEFLTLNDYRYAYSLNLETLKNCLKTLFDLHVIRISKKDDDTFYSINANNLYDIYNLFSKVTGEGANLCGTLTLNSKL